MQNNLFENSPSVQLGEIESWCVENDLLAIIGVDEAGRGPLAGPVTAAACVLDLEKLDEDWITLLDDSKKLSETQRDEAAIEVRKHAIAYSVVSMDQAVIDEINILQATIRAMEEAVKDVAEQIGQVDRVFIDGKITLNVEHDQQYIVKGDGKSYAIAAASILAKTTRDALMKSIDITWPEYGFAKHKGYPTVHHRNVIAELGPCPHHRTTFAGVKEHLERMRSETT